MASRTTGWAQRRTAPTASPTAFQPVINAILGTATAPTATTLATAQAFEVTAGVAISIRWGGGGFNDLGWGGTSAANTEVAYLCIFDETSQTLFDGAATTVNVVNTSGSAPVAVSCHDKYQPAAGAGAASVDQTFTFTPTHTGTVRLFVRYQTYVSATNSIVGDFNSDGANFGSHAEMIPGTSIAGDFTPGLVRSGTTLTSFNQSPASPWYFTNPATTVVNTLTAGAAPAAADGTYSVSWRDQTPTQFATSTIPSSTTAATSDAGLAVNPTNAFPAAATTLSFLVTPSSSALSTALTGASLPWIHFTSLPAGITGTTDTAGNYITFTKASGGTADPRIQLGHLLQVNDNTFGSPPLSKDISTDQRLTSDLGFIATRAQNMNGVGINGLTINQTLADNGNLVATISQSSTTATEGGDLGWTNPPMAWSSGLPGGAWQQNRTADGFTCNQGFSGSYIVTQQETLSLLSANPNFVLVVGGGNASNTLDHFSNGKAFIVGVALQDRSVQKYVILDASPSPSITILRLNLATGHGQYLASDQQTWTDLYSGGTQVAAYAFPLTQGVADPNIWTLTIPGANTALWTGGYTIFLVGVAYAQGTPYTNFGIAEVTGLQNLHSTRDKTLSGLLGLPAPA